MATTELVTQSTALTPAELLRIAVTQGADIEKLSQLMDLQERWEKNEARKAYVAAMAAFKSAAPRIGKNKHVHFDTAKGPTDYNHATLDHVCDAVTKALSTVGISHRWKVDQDKDWITVTCILTHEFGHSEETKLIGAPDNTGSKNSIQAIGSTVTYLQRYTLLAATGLAAANSDTDGRVPVSTTAIPKDKVQEHCEWIANAGDMDELGKLYRNAYREADTAKDRAAMAAYIRAKDTRKAELQ